jgi:phytoene desaturase
MSKEILIVGAGPASAGLKVKVVERLPVVGGRTSVIEAEGYRFDLGPTFFLYPQVLREIFAGAGAELEREVELVRLDPQYRIVFGGGDRIDATPDVRRMEEQIRALSPRDAGGFRRFLAENRTKLELMQPCLQSPFLELARRVEPAGA